MSHVSTWMGDRLGIHGVVDILSLLYRSRDGPWIETRGGEKNIFEVSIKLNISFLNEKK